ncbi:glucose-6-phosphate isomerase [Clostridium aminobutyricum]|uniref:Glucose-6-phosphate isomerase n=1 Tax=Clostridium aminobutyricum TaxID=33953 RepID=A0A939DA50_CLOAM|nr:glucose-6-phosphate isomerase [Clostridium aminobutyricum]MBN7774031.1 glucose-6-phosphate isomerase [Clostridium aminobutyricum]
MDLKIDISRTGVTKEQLKNCAPKVEEAMEKLWSGQEEYTGWVKLPLQYGQDELEHLLNTAALIQTQCEILIVIGVGGSYLGTRAAVHALVGPDEIYGSGLSPKSYPEIKFAGNNISGTYHSQLLEDIRKKDVCLCVISKSGTTTETSIAFAILKAALIEKYGKEEAVKRIYAITDKAAGSLREEAEREGYESFEIPDDIGGRYSVLTSVGLLPMAAAGIDIKSMLAGAAAMASSTEWDYNGTDYAVARYELMKTGKQIEIVEYYEPQLDFFAEWLKQLFGESEGKEGKGLFPSSLHLTTDLHSMGQFLQEGNQIFFETILNVKKPARDLPIPNEAGGLFEGKSMNEVNRAALEAVLAAHEASGVPMVKIDIPEINAYYFGQLIYFFETSCSITAYLMGVNPFNQPGVERYKSEMKKMLQQSQPCKA